MNAAARPAKRDEERRQKYMAFRVNAEEATEIEALAKHYHFSIAEYLRRSALGYLHADRNVVTEKNK